MTAETFEYQTEYLRSAFATKLEEGLAKGFARGEAEGRARGEAEGRARSVVRVLERRGLDVTADIRARIVACTDLDELDTWLDRALTVDTAEDLFA